MKIHKLEIWGKLACSRTINTNTKKLDPIHFHNVWKDKFMSRLCQQCFWSGVVNR